MEVCAVSLIISCSDLFVPSSSVVTPLGLVLVLLPWLLPLPPFILFPPLFGLLSLGLPLPLVLGLLLSLPLPLPLFCLCSLVVPNIFFKSIVSFSNINNSFAISNVYDEVTIFVSENDFTFTSLLYNKALPCLSNSITR